VTARHLRLDGELTVVTAAEWHERLVSWLATSGDRDRDLDLDVSRVTDLDTAGLQLLLAVKREAWRAGVRLTLRDPGPVVLDVLAIAHLDADLDTDFDADSDTAFDADSDRET
jgi:anti-sigma B factor antagonist